MTYYFNLSFHINLYAFVQDNRNESLASNLIEIRNCLHGNDVRRI